MNERIQELWTQAENRQVDEEGRVWISPVFTTKDKFAELIVRECLDQITSGPDPAYYSTEAVVRIRKHFGIP